MQYESTSARLLTMVRLMALPIAENAIKEDRGIRQLALHFEICYNSCQKSGGQPRSHLVSLTLGTNMADGT